MSDLRSLSGGKRTYRGHRISVVIDPEQTCQIGAPTGMRPLHFPASPNSAMGGECANASYCCSWCRLARKPSPTK
jgi:hypothetical protein